MEFKLAAEDQISKLTRISKEAFDSDISVGAPGIGGPPNYDSEKWHAQRCRYKNLYSIIEDKQVIGGVLPIGCLLYPLLNIIPYVMKKRPKNFTRA